MKMIILFCIVFLIKNGVLSAQDIATDSKNKGVFTYFAPKKYRFDFSSKDFSLTFASLKIYTPYLYNLTKDTTVYKSSNYYLQPSLLNVSDIISFSGGTKPRPGVKLKFGYQTLVDSIRSISQGWTYAFGWNIYASVDNIKLYNTDNSIVEKKYPFAIGGEINYTQFLPIKWMLLSFAGSYTNGWNDNSLLKYKSLGSDVVLDGNIVAFKEFDGHYGKLKTKLNRGRFSFSAPISGWYVNPIPYVVLVAEDDAKPLYFIGLYANILSKKVNFHAFQLPSTLGIGIDKTSAAWSKWNIFLRGSINLSEL